MSFSWSRAGAIAKKEMYHVLRDPFVLVFSLGPPVFLLFVFGLAIEFNVKNIPLAVNDMDHTQSATTLIENFGSSGYFIIHPVRSPKIAEDRLWSGQDRAALIIPNGFQRDLFSGRNGAVQILLDGSDNSTVQSILGYVSTIQKIAAEKIAHFDSVQNVNLKTRFLFNPELNSRWFVIPGLMVTIMSVLTILLTALTIAREWENGSMELLLSTPIKPLEIIIGKLAPYAVLGTVGVTFVYVVSRLFFKVPFHGSIVVFGSGCILFLITYLSQGLLISVVTRSQQVAMQIAIMSGLLPAQLLSGFIFPIESMPEFFRYFTMIFPARWFMIISRQSYLKGSTLSDLSIPFMALGILCLLMILMAKKKFKRDLEP